MISYLNTGGMGERGSALGAFPELEQHLGRVAGAAVGPADAGDDDSAVASMQACARPALRGARKSGPDGVTAYLHSIASCSLLSAEREREVATRIRQGVNELIQLVADHAAGDPLIRDLHRKVKQLQSQEETFPGVRDKIVKVIRRVLEKAARDQPLHPLYGKMTVRIEAIMSAVDQAKQEMVCGNLRLVLSIAKRFRGRGLSFEDLVQEGNLGLIKAVVRYDHTKGNRFSTYATWWVRQSIIRGIYDKSRTIRLPVHCIEQRNRFCKVFNELVIEYGRDPSLHEIAERIDLSLEKLQAILTHGTQHLSLETPVGDEEQRLGDLLVDDASASPMNEFGRKELEEVVCLALSRLQPREEKIVRMRFGIGRYHPQTLEAIGNHFGVSKERIRQIEKKALSKLGTPLHCGQLLEMWETE